MPSASRRVDRSIARGEKSGRYVVVQALSRAHRETSRAFVAGTAASFQVDADGRLRPQAVTYRYQAQTEDPATR